MLHMSDVYCAGGKQRCDVAPPPVDAARIVFVDQSGRGQPGEERLHVFGGVCDVEGDGASRGGADRRYPVRAGAGGLPEHRAQDEGYAVSGESWRAVSGAVDLVVVAAVVKSVVMQFFFFILISLYCLTCAHCLWMLPHVGRTQTMRGTTLWRSTVAASCVCSRATLIS